MPPRFAYWTILAGGLPTAFRAAEREELLPTFNRLKEKQPDAEMKYFARGKLWESADEARRHAEGTRRQTDQREGRPHSSQPGERRGPDWRPGGAHRDPRQPFKDAKKARNQDRRQERFDRKQAAFAPRTPAARPHREGDRKPWAGKPRGHGDRRPGFDKPRPEGDRQPWSDRPRSQSDRKPWAHKPRGDGDRKPWAGPPRDGRPRPPRERAASAPPAAAPRPHGDPFRGDVRPGGGRRPFQPKGALRGGRSGPPGDRRSHDERPPRPPGPNREPKPGKEPSPYPPPRTSEPRIETPPPERGRKKPRR